MSDPGLSAEAVREPRRIPTRPQPRRSNSDTRRGKENLQNMSKTMLVNVTHVEESRVGILVDGVLAEYELETINRTSLKGNIFNAVVESVHASLEAAFVRIGPDLKGFLPLDEVNFKLLPARGERGKQGRIGQHLHMGQKLMVQVVREPFAGKPPTVSTYFSLPGRFLVLMPGVDSTGISRKIEDGTQRDRLKKLLSQLKVPEGFGMIVRTAGIGQTKTELTRDLRYLLRLWESIQRASKGGEFPGIVYREADLVIRTIRDHLAPDISEVWIDSQETHDRALAFVKDVMPNRAKTLKLYSGERPLFNRHNLEEQIERIYKRRVPLPSGGEIVIDGTEALTAIDVNSARSKRQGDVEETITQTNLEAAGEIARQLRLRDLGGLVVIDFIDMMAMRNKKKVEKAMRDAMKGDKAKYDITVISKLGLMEIARQRIKGEKMASSYATCPSCDGHGLIKNIETAALAALRKLQTRCARGGFGKLRLALPPEVANWLLNAKREEILRIERRYSIHIELAPNPELLRHESSFETFAREKTEERPAPEAEAAQPVPSEPAARGDQGAASRRSPRRAEREAPAEPAAAEAAETPPPAAEPEGIKTEAAGSTEKKEADPATPPSGEAQSERPRRRRKRRRKPRSASQSAKGNGETDAKSSAGQGDGNNGAPRPDDADRLVVPRGVRADELLPAASGSAAGGRGNKSKGGKSSSGGGSSRKKSRSRGRGGRSRRGSSRSGDQGAQTNG